jgi:heptosyltransferase-3
MIVPEKIIISRTDSIGDVVLTLPMAGVLKSMLPGIKIIFLGRRYTRPIIEASVFVDEFVNWDEIEKLGFEEQRERFSALSADCIIHVFPDSAIARLASASSIRYRIGTTNRFYHWLYCNKLVSLSRKSSNLHEAQLNLKLVEPLIGKKEFLLAEIPAYYGLNNIQPVPSHFAELLDKSKFNLILHPRSKGSGREWRLENFSSLIKLLPKESFKIFISGTKEDGEALKDFLTANKNEVTDITGQMNLPTFISFIKNADGLIAASTGPLHIAAALGIYALGIYAPMRPIFPQRWAPVGDKASYLVKDAICNDCKKTLQCHCMNEVTPAQVFRVVKGWRK